MWVLFLGEFRNTFRATNQVWVAPMSEHARHRCRNPRCRSKLQAPIENHHHAFCTRGCYESFYRSRCRVCERRLDVDPMTGAKRIADGRRRLCGRKCASVARLNSGTYQRLPPCKPDARSAHSTGLKTGLAPIRAPSYVLDIEIWGNRTWRDAVSSAGVPVEIGCIRPRALKS